MRSTRKGKSEVGIYCPLVTADVLYKWLVTVISKQQSALGPWHSGDAGSPVPAPIWCS
jgi:hypothetical protein